MNKLYLAFFLVLSLAACDKKGSAQGLVTPVTPVVIDTTATIKSDFIKGADVSWLTEMEKAGKKFYNNAGAEKECMQLMKDLGMNAIRLRVWVNPTDGYCNTADVLAKALRAKGLGMKLLIDFHYSDWWADPGKQNKPAAWVAKDIEGLKQSVSSHTTEVLQELKKNGIVPEWVQVGNETNNGMLWPEGKASVNMKNFAELIKAGYQAVKAVDAGIKVMVHISNGYDNSLFRWMFDGLKNNGAEWDMIGMSLYPEASNWQTLNSQCLSNMNDMVSRYGKEIMIVEVGMSWSEANSSKAFLTDLINKVKSVQGGKGKGIMYWEPESYNNWKGYSLGAFDNSGKPTVAMEAFK